MIKKSAGVFCIFLVVLMVFIALGIEYGLAQAKTQPEFANVLLENQSLQLAAVPTKTPTPLSPPPESVELFRDDFEDPQYNGKFNDWNWWEFFLGDYDKAKAAQENGVLKMQAEFTGKEGGFYGLFHYYPSLDYFAQAEVKVKATKLDHSDAHVVIYPRNASEGWYFYFGIFKNEKGEGEVYCDPSDSLNMKPFKTLAVDLNEWHTLTIRYDKKKTTFSFYVDNRLLGSANVANALKKTAPDSSYAFSIQLGGRDGGKAEAYVDYVVLYAPQEKADSLPEKPKTFPTIEAVEIPIEEASPTSLGEMKVFTYNILWGGAEDEKGPNDITEERLTKVLAYLEKQQADIIALQELNGWQNGDPNIMDQVAKKMGYNGYLALYNSYHNGLLSKYPILETKNLSSYLGNVGGMYARLDSPFGPVNVFNVHFDPFDQEKRKCQFQRVVELARPYRSELTLILGDFNTNLPFQREGYARAAGYSIDQIWASPAFKATRKTYVADKEAYDLSDHLPVGVSFYINEKVPKSVQSKLQFPTDELKPLEIVGNADILSRYKEPQEIVIPMNDRCDVFAVFELSGNSTFTDEGIKLIGEGDWSTNMYLRRELSEKEGALITFSYKGNKEFNIFLQYGEWDTDPVRRFGVGFVNNRLSSHYLAGKEWLEGKKQYSVPLKPEKKYDLLLTNDGDGRFSVALWESEDSTQVLLNLTTEQFDDSWKGRSYRLISEVNKGEVVVISKIIPFKFEGVSK